MTRGQEETSTSLVGRRREPSRESPTASSIVASMSVEELKSSYRVLDDMNLQLSNGPTFSTVGEANNTIYLTREQFTAGLHCHVSSLVKQFLHVTQAPLALIHLNGFWILMGSNVLNFLYQLDISLVDICFIYTLMPGTGGRLSMLVHSPWLQFITGLPNSPKTEKKKVVLVRVPCYKTTDTLGLSFDVN